MLSLSPTTVRVGNTLQLSVGGFTPGATINPASLNLRLNSAYGIAETKPYNVLPSGNVHYVFFTVPTSPQVPSGTVYTVELLNGTVGSTSYASTNTLTFTVLATPSVTLAPASGARGSRQTVTFTGAYTSFSAVSVLNFGPGISVVSRSVDAGAQRITAVIDIDRAAALGARTVSVTSGAEVVSASFTVDALSALTLLSLTPQRSRLGGTIQLSVGGFPAGATIAPAALDITLTSSYGTVPVKPYNVQASGNVHYLFFNVPVTPAVPPETVYTVALVAGTVDNVEYASTNTLTFTVIGDPSMTLTPDSGRRGATATVTIQGANTSFDSTSVVSFGPGITVTAATVDAAQQRILAAISIGASAALGSRAVTVTTGGEVVSAAFSVAASQPSIISVAPSSGTQGTTVAVTITGENTSWQQGSTQVSFGEGITVNSVQVGSATSLVTNITIAPNATVAARTVTVTTGSESVTGAFAVSAASAPTITLNPASGTQGATLNVAITGENTHFVQGTTTASFGAGITVNSVTVTGPTAATANITIASNATVGARTATVTTGSESVTAAFAVIAATAPTVTLNPTSGLQGTTLNVAITGQGTHFVQGTTTASFGPGITVNSVTVTGPTAATASITITDSAALGARSVTLTTGTETTQPATFTVEAGTPAILSITPGGARPGNTLTVTITGRFTHFQQGVTTVSFGAGITTGAVTVTSATQLTATITVLTNAAIGARVVTVATGSETASGSFAVLQAPAAGPLRCKATAGVPPLVRAEGYTELTGDLVVVCTGGSPGAQSLVNVQLFLNTNITSRTLNSSGYTEALLMVDELGLTGTNANATPAVYPALRVENTQNALVWPGVTIVAPGDAERTLRITNVRANAAGLGTSQTLIPTQVVAYLSFSPSQSLAVDNPQQTVGYVQQGMIFDVRSCSGGSLTTPIGVNQCQGQNADWYGDPVRSSGFAAQFGLRFREGFQTAFKPRISPGQNASIPGQVFNSESGFVHTGMSETASAILDAAGIADSGTRLAARFVNVPANVRIFVATTNVASGVARAALVTTDASGATNYYNLNPTPGAIAPLYGPTKLTCGSTEYAAIEVPLTNGSGVAVWEVDTSNPSAVEEFIFPAGFAYRANVQAGQPALGTAQVIGNLAPFYGAGAAERASAGMVIPRFASRTDASSIFRINQCVTNLLFPYVTNQAGFDTGIAISNTSQDPFSSPSDRLQAGRCTLNYYGRLANGNPPSMTSEQTDRDIAAGETLTFILSGGGNYGVKGNAGFQGYIIAQCGFLYAHGFAFITDGPVGSARVAEGYLSLVLDGADAGRLRGSTLGESRGK